jgi:sugar/nucleoside kinase (ribokinase family)
VTRRIDVLGIGCAAIDDIIYIDGVPVADGKARVISQGRDFGGLTATALVTAARLGAACCFASRLGNDAGSVAIIRDLRRAGVVVPRRTLSEDARPVRSTVISSLGTGARAIYFTNPEVTGAHPEMSEKLVRRARVLVLDGYGFEGSLRAARIAREAQIPVIADFENADHQHFSELLGLVDHLVLSQPFAQELTGTASVHESLRMLWDGSRQIVAITTGATGSSVLTRGTSEVLHVPAYPVEVVETRGCGDVFHGAYAAALAFGYPILSAVRFATVAAGLKAAQFGTRQGLPTRAEVEAVLPESDRLP